MIAVRPETLDFVISAPSDYSLVPELCPSGNLVLLTSSDEYFVVECQPDNEEQIRPKGVSVKSFAGSLATWATQMHYDNARHPLIFRTSGGIDENAETLARSELTIMQVEAKRGRSQPHRNHPVWARSLDHHVTTAQVEQNFDKLCAITGDASLRQRALDAGRLRSLLLGRAPHFRMWHPLWPDAALVERIIARAAGNLAIVSDLPARGRAWLDGLTKRRGEGTRSTSFSLSRCFLNEPKSERYDTIVCYLDPAAHDVPETLGKLHTLLSDHGSIDLILGRMFDDSAI